MAVPVHQMKLRTLPETVRRFGLACDDDNRTSHQELVALLDLRDYVLGRQRNTPEILAQGTLRPLRVTEAEANAAVLLDG